MNESGFWAKVAKEFNKKARIRKIHAGVFDDGIPDGVYTVDGIQGFLELKYVRRWPARQATTVKCDVTPTQRAWLEDWIAHGGRAHVLLGVEFDWFLLRISDVPVDGRITRAQFIRLRDSGHWGTFDLLADLPAIVAKATP